MAIEEMDKQLYWEGYNALHYLSNVDGYNYLGHISTGRYGNVFAMYDNTLKLPVAVKCTEDPGAVTEEWQRFEHSNLVPLLKIYLLDLCAIFVMPLFRKNLKNLLDNEGFYKDSLSYDFCRIWIKDVLNALYHLHYNELAHLKLKLENVFLKDDGHVCLGDYSFMSNSYDVDFNSPFLEYFEPPEFTLPFYQSQGIKPYDIPLCGKGADMWILGFLIIDMLTNKRFTISGQRGDPDRKSHLYKYVVNILEDSNYLQCCLQGKFKTKKFDDDEVEDCHDFLKNILSTHPDHRMPSLQATCHPFMDVEWPKIPSEEEASFLFDLEKTRDTPFSSRNGTQRRQSPRQAQGRQTPKRKGNGTPVKKKKTSDPGKGKAKA